MLEDLTRAPVGSPSFGRTMRSIDRIGEREVRSVAAVAARFGDRPARQIAEVLADQSALARHVRAVRELARAFDRTRDLKRLAADVARRENDLRALAQALEDDRVALMTDNALLGQQERALTLNVRSLERWSALATRLDELLVEYIAVLRATDAEAARVLERDVLYGIRQRARDLLMQLAVAQQGLASVRIIANGNAAVIYALRVAATTTLTALRTAGLVMRARKVDQVSATGWHDLLGVLDELERGRRASLLGVKRGSRSGS